MLFQHLEGSFRNSDMMRISHPAYDKLFLCLMSALQDDCRYKSLGFLNIFYSRSVFVNILIPLHTIRRWSISHSPDSAYGSALSFDEHDDLLILFLERTIEVGKGEHVCNIVKDIGQAKCTQAWG